MFSEHWIKWLCKRRRHCSWVEIIAPDGHHVRLGRFISCAPLELRDYSAHADGVFCTSVLNTHLCPKGETVRLGNDCLSTHESCIRSPKLNSVIHKENTFDTTIHYRQKWSLTSWRVHVWKVNALQGALLTCKKNKDEKRKNTAACCMETTAWQGGPGALERVLAVVMMSCSTRGCLIVSNRFLLSLWCAAGLGGHLTLQVLMTNAATTQGAQPFLQR